MSTFASVILMFSLMILGSFATSERTVSHSIFVKCSNRTVGFTAAHCLEACGSDYIGSDITKITVYKSTYQESIPMGKCSKYVRTVELSETWTFSKLPPIVDITEVRPLYSECIDEWSKLCGIGNPCVSEIPPVPKNYAWATSVISKSVYIHLDISQVTTSINFRESPMISTPEGLAKMQEGHVYSNTGMGMILWENKDRWRESCNLDRASVHNCFLSGEADSVICPDISLKLKRNRAEIGGCNEPIYYDQGIFFSESVSDHMSTGSEVFSGTPLEGIGTQISSIITYLSIKESHDCISKCGKLTVSSVDEFISFPISVYKRALDGRMRKCNPLPHCDIEFPLTSCSKSSLIKVMCSHHSEWWDPKDGFELKDKSCKSDDEVVAKGETRLPLGGETLIINETGHYWETNDNDIPLRLGVISKKQIKVVSSTIKSKVVPISRNSEDIIRDDVVHSRSLVETFYSALTMIDDWITHQIRVVLIIAIIVLMVVLWYRRRNTKKNIPNKRINRLMNNEKESLQQASEEDNVMVEHIFE
ncbi:TPA_asm: G [Ipomoea betacytorhabdovirus 1]|nr:TPA_asm: G [Ipomoea betacytorhabdovirus 1]